MNNDLVIRSLLVDKKTGKYIKAVDERGLDDYINLLTKKNENSEVIIFDFFNVVTFFHKELDAKLAALDYRDLAVKRATVFNTWVRLKSLTNENAICQTALQISRDAEEVLSWIYTRIPELDRKYFLAKDDNIQFHSNEKNSALLKLSNELETFLEILICHIYATVKIDTGYFKTEFILRQHCLNVRKFVLSALCSELNYWQGTFRYDSMIFQCCMEDLGINTEALLFQIESTKSVEDLRASVLSSSEIQDMSDGYNTKRVYTVSWPSSSPNNINRVKTLSKLLQKINSIILLLECLKNNNVKFNDSPAEQEEFERNLESLMLKDKT